MMGARRRDKCICVGGSNARHLCICAAILKRSPATINFNHFKALKYKSKIKKYFPILVGIYRPSFDTKPVFFRAHAV